MNIKNSFVILFISFISFNSFSQEIQKAPINTENDSILGYFLLINSEKPSKKIIIKDIGAYTLTYKEEVFDTITVQKTHFATGNFRDMNENSVLFDVRNESIEQTFKDGSLMGSSNDYSSFYYSQNETARSIALKDALHLDYSSPARSLVHTTGVGTMVLSAAIALVVGPLLSIEYTKEKNYTIDGKQFYEARKLNFNESTYLNGLKIGVIGFAVGFPMAKLSKMIRYNLTDDKMKADRDFWIIQKQTEE